MSHQRVRKILSELKRLRRMSKKDRHKYLKTCDESSVDCVCECMRNLLKGRVPLKTKQLKALKRFKKFIRKAASKKTSRKKRRKTLQKGGFIGAILPPLVAGLSGLLGTLLNRNG